MMSKIPVLLPDQPLPAYSYVPGKFPHPVRDPKGHSFGKEAEKVADFCATPWQQCRPYLHGIDLFNHGFYWESHEAWEAVWNAAGRRGVVADFLKGLIKLAAAGVKAREGRATGVSRHAARSEELFTGVQSSLTADAKLMGLPLVELRSYAKQLVRNAEETVDTSDEPVVLVHDFVITPR